MPNLTPTALVSLTLALSAGLAFSATSGATPAPKPVALKTNFIDHSQASLIDNAGAKAVLAANISAKVLKLYPANKYAFVSQVEGGLTSAKACVVTARVMLLPVTSAMKAPLFRPEKTATAFDMQAGATADQCKALALDKLKEATLSVVSALVKT